MLRPMQGNSSSSGGVDQDVEREAAARGGSSSYSSSAPGFDGTEKAQAATQSTSENADHTNAISADNKYTADGGRRADHAQSHSHSHEDKEIQRDDRRPSHSLQRQRSLAGNSTTMSLKPHDDDDDASSSGSNSFVRAMNKTSRWLGNYRIESVSIAPVRLEARTQKKWWSVGLLWLSANHNLLSFSTGTLVLDLPLSPTAAYCTIIFFCLGASLFPAYFATFGPRTGMRQLIHTRYSWGWFAPVIAVLNAASLCGYCILNSILGGQTLSAVSPNGSLSASVGIVIIAIISLVVSFCGITVLHAFERWVWVPILICFCILAGLAGSGPDGLHFQTGAAVETTTTSSGVLGFAGVIFGFLVSWSSIASDFSCYLDPAATPSWGLFTAALLGFFLGTAPPFLLGASFGLSARDIPAWNDALSTSNGALFNLVMSSKAGGFGKFVTVLLGLGIVGNTAPSIYSFGLSMPAILPVLAVLPRFIFPIIAIAIIIPLAIVGATAFYGTLTSFTGVLAYWSALFVAVVCVDHIIIRRRDFSTYDVTIWNQWRKLPIGLAAIASAVLSLGILIPSISQTWFEGPIARKTGDLGFELGFVCCAILYAPLRLLEKRLVGR